MFCSQGGSVSRLKAGGGPNAGGGAAARPFCSPSVQKGPFSLEVWSLAFGIVCIGTELIGFLGRNAHGYLRPMSLLRAMGKVMPGPPPQQVA